MARIAPDGPVYQAGTLSGNPLAMCAGIATLDLLDEPGAYERLEHTSEALARELSDVFEKAAVPATIQRVGSMLTLFFTEGPVTDFRSASACDTERFAVFFHRMLERGVHLPPSQFEAWFVSLAHGEAEIRETVEAARYAFREEQ